MAPAPSLRNLVLPSVGALDVGALVLAAAAGGAYLVAVHRLAVRGRRWRPARTAAFLGGLAVILVATQSGLARYDTVLFSVHVVQHVLLGMVAPVLLVAGAPVTLALQAGHPGTKVLVRRALHHPVVGAVAHPVTATVLFSGTLVILYSTPLYEATLRHAWLHAWLHVHFVVVGFLWAAAVLAVDPHPVRLPYAARLGLVVVTVPFHAVLGVALLNRSSVIAADWYERVDRSWGASPLTDQRTGAGILWGVGELFALAVGSAVLVAWMHHSEREAARNDRRLDAALASGGPPS